MMSPIGLRTRNTRKQKGMLTIPRSNVYSQPFTFKPTRDWPDSAFKMKNKKKKKGEITARDTRGVQFELNQVTKLYDFASEEKVHRRQASRMKLKSTGLDRFDADGTPRRNAMQHLGSVGKLKYVQIPIYLHLLIYIIILTFMKKKLKINDILKQIYSFNKKKFLLQSFFSMCVSYISNSLIILIICVVYI